MTAGPSALHGVASNTDGLEAVSASTDVGGDMPGIQHGRLSSTGRLQSRKSGATLQLAIHCVLVANTALFILKPIVSNDDDGHSPCRRRRLVLQNRKKRRRSALCVSA